MDDRVPTYEAAVSTTTAAASPLSTVPPEPDGTDVTDAIDLGTVSDITDVADVIDLRAAEAQATHEAQEPGQEALAQAEEAAEAEAQGIEVDIVAGLRSQLDAERECLARLAADLEAARNENRLELVPSKVLREREQRERATLERAAHAEGRGYELTVHLYRERDRADALIRELERVRSVLTTRQRRKLGLD